MTTYKKKIDFSQTPAGEQARQVLLEMVSSSAYNTTATYSADEDLHPDHRISFVEKHMVFLSSHPSTDPNHYIANLRLKTKIR